MFASSDPLARFSRVCPAALAGNGSRRPALGRRWPPPPARGGARASALLAPGLADQAMTDLRQAAAVGWRNPAAYRHEPAMGPLRERQGFKLLMMDLAMPAEPFATAR